jgi:hypothetical protein
LRRLPFASLKVRCIYSLSFFVALFPLLPSLTRCYRASVRALPLPLHPPLSGCTCSPLLLPPCPPTGLERDHGRGRGRVQQLERSPSGLITFSLSLRLPCSLICINLQPLSELASLYCFPVISHSCSSIPTAMTIATACLHHVPPKVRLCPALNSFLQLTQLHPYSHIFYNRSRLRLAGCVDAASPHGVTCAKLLRVHRQLSWRLYVSW